ncbi:MFS transporter [Halalkalibacter akibai]|uniref:Macrolide efflux protein n=1 Tax=Halalkalibacter akibai (strain ATCC 43226 / DSM 21942 / CIP 109018 / JCM 9157 / 1139) TaxID=1236973 RepID=W4R257_HALA3|nr:MFS transporter [Halalkalibacter akibai]GAE37639.1 macrolide efflux protein [Halalkalibacter akibai JCM 9157]
MFIFSNKNFLFMFLGRIVTNIGDTLYAVAAMWLVFELGGSTFYTGLAGFLTIIPRFVQFFAGPLIDRISIRPLLIVTQIIQSIMLLIIPIAYFFDFLSVTLILIISPIITTFNMLVYPAQVATLPKIVEEKELTKANSLFTFAYQGIETACNAIAGVLLVTIGAISIYLLDSIMFLIGALLFSFIKLPMQTKKVKKTYSESSILCHLKQYKIELKEGISILLNKTFSRLLIGIMAINFVGGATFVVLPDFSKHQGGAEIFGYLLMAQALGSIMGALLAPYIKLQRYGIGKVYAMAFIISGILWTISVFSPWTWLMIIIYALAWFPGGVTNILINTFMQRGIPKHLLGRVFSASFSLSGIAMPLGSLIGGALGVIIGSVYVILCSGIVIFLVGVFWSIDKVTRTLPKLEEVTETTFISEVLARKLSNQK